MYMFLEVLSFILFHIHSIIGHILCNRFLLFTFKFAFFFPLNYDYWNSCCIEIAILFDQHVINIWFSFTIQNIHVYTYMYIHTYMYIICTYIWLVISVTNIICTYIWFLHRTYIRTYVDHIYAYVCVSHMYVYICIYFISSDFEK